MFLRLFGVGDRFSTQTLSAADLGQNGAVRMTCSKRECSLKLSESLLQLCFVQAASFHMARQFWAICSTGVSSLSSSVLKSSSSCWPSCSSSHSAI